METGGPVASCFRICSRIIVAFTVLTPFIFPFCTVQEEEEEKNAAPGQARRPRALQGSDSDEEEQVEYSRALGRLPP